MTLAVTAFAQNQSVVLSNWEGKMSNCRIQLYSRTNNFRLPETNFYLPYQTTNVFFSHSFYAEEKRVDFFSGEQLVFFRKINGEDCDSWFHSIGEFCNIVTLQKIRQ
jgi:hypothetical protein